MREIKFRVWDVAGNQFYDDSSGDWKVEFIDGWVPQLVVLEERWIQTNPDNSNDGYQDFYWSVVEDARFQEYTGLKDKNGKEIYEGDICETVTYSGKPFGTIDVVKFSGGAFKLTDIEDALLPIPLDDSDIQSVEVIGNIYENPELLEWKE